jgi:hypothetical protein
MSDREGVLVTVHHRKFFERQKIDFVGTDYPRSGWTHWYPAKDVLSDLKVGDSISLTPNDIDRMTREGILI